ncbi:hypothetical protein DICPUDRAFT_97365 [Dictyostelium purpureum]|uniref:NADP-dependent oxidoreductase domain-containing protein n=1 Tax=Dictyostelium purpureum TaxID=5786 RepID=F0ZG48_DICPU|nr:uncharacterized protein DICPUDRAFT_97365 [Dictyostelium purpureum]EGC37099.1 hypothetical protein DICPUDRAFT_97365 [Dictyostelium purpureum]|eukprot:XP_003286380.1 hypothetical protein DICPUDRAFT_97365 [Dictyostelium purpureum]
MSSINIKTTIKKGNVEIPQFGLGTYLVDPKDIESSVRAAVNNGYIHIDTASYYKNEQAIGDVLKAIFKEGKIKREDIFITTKCGCIEHGKEESRRAFERSLSKLQLEYIDLYLVHYPGMLAAIPKGETSSSLRKQTWETFEELYNEKKIRSIGVSNYTIRHLEELFAHAKIRPVVNQVEFHPLLNQVELLNFCNKNDIILEAYGSLGGGELVDHPTIVNIAKQVNKTTSQVLLRWAIQKNLMIIPKSTKEERIKENANIFDFELSSAHITQLDSLNKNKRFYWNPEDVQ